MKTRRSKIASDVFTSVKTFFEATKFKNVDAMRDYIHWALQSGGPAFYETPIPMSCTLKKDDPDGPVSAFNNQRLALTIRVRNQMVSCARSSCSQPPRYIWASQQCRFSVLLWDQGTHQRACTRCS